MLGLFFCLLLDLFLVLTNKGVDYYLRYELLLAVEVSLIIDKVQIFTEFVHDQSK